MSLPSELRHALFKPGYKGSFRRNPAGSNALIEIPRLVAIQQRFIDWNHAKFVGGATVIDDNHSERAAWWRSFFVDPSCSCLERLTPGLSRSSRIPTPLLPGPCRLNDSFHRTQTR